jgi:uncharacterized phiE125 gp8 family phage protein
MRYLIRTVTPLDDVELVITLDEAKAHLGVHFEDDDDLILALGMAAQDHVERYTGQVLTPREMEMSLRGFPIDDGGRIEIPRAPVTDISLIAYTDGDGVAAELEQADWRWFESVPEVVLPAYTTSWPAAYDEAGSVRVTFQAGYEVGLAPGSLVGAVKLMLGHLYANREAVVVGTISTELPFAVDALCRPYRRVSL